MTKANKHVAEVLPASAPKKGMSKTGKYDRQNKWTAEHTTRIVMNLNHNTDADLLNYLKTVESKQGLIKQLLRNHISQVASDGEK